LSPRGDYQQLESHARCAISITSRRFKRAFRLHFFLDGAIRDVLGPGRSIGNRLRGIAD
jgi:hypothetical protein